MIRERFGWLQSWINAVKLSAYESLKRQKRPVIIIPRRDYWIVKGKAQAVFYPLDASGYPRIHPLNVYNYRGFVEVEKGDIVCDIGAHIGEFALLISNLASKIICFEPDPQNIRFFKRNTAHLKNLTLIKNPLWNENTIVEFILGDQTDDSSIINIDSERERGRLRLQANRLDSLFSKFNIEKIDFLKLDAEGAEPEVLEGAEGIFSKIMKIAVDCSPERDGQSTTDAVLKILKRAGFKIILRNNRVYGRKN